MSNLFVTSANHSSLYSQTSIIRGTWAYKILVSKTADKRGPRIIEVRIIKI